MAVPRRVRKLYRIRKPSRKFETAFHQFYDNVGHGRIADDLHGAELNEFLDFLDEVLQLEDLNPELFRKALHGLWSTCSRRGILPGAYIISEGLSTTGNAPLASGGYADVWVGELTRRNLGLKKVCIKTMKVPSRNGPEKVEKAWREEVSVWMRLKHPNVVQCLGATINPPQIIMDWMPMGEVMECVRKDPAADRLHFVFGVTEGLHHLHSHGVIHGDVKTPNILVNARGDACISDFGLAIVTRGKGATGYEDSGARGHSSLWAAPEILINAQVSKEADVFSYSLVALEILKGDSPWGQATVAQVMTKITLGERPARPEGPKTHGLTTKLWNGLTKCWCARPEDRITISEVLELLYSTSRVQPLATIEKASSRRDDGRSEWHHPPLPPLEHDPTHAGSPPRPESVLSAPITDPRWPRYVVSPDTAGPPNKNTSMLRTVSFPTIRKLTGPGKARALRKGLRALSCRPDIDPDDADHVSYPHRQPGNNCPHTTAPTIT